MQKETGIFAYVRSDDLGIVGIHALMERTKGNSASIYDILIGTLTQFGEQSNIAKDIAKPAVFTLEVPGIGVDRACCL